MKKILGLDLGTTSIGWAYVNEAETNEEKSSIVKLGVRVIPLSSDEETDFMKGKATSINADRTLKRGARRNLDRYQERRDALIEILKDNGFISDDILLNEDGKNTTFNTYESRAKAAKKIISKEEFAKVLLMINKKRGYKSSRKAKSEEEGSAIDGMLVAKYIYDNGLTPGQYVYQLLRDKKKYIPDFYRSDLQSELSQIWEFQKQFHANILTEEFFEQISGKGKMATSKIFLGKYEIYTAENKGKRDDVKLQSYKWRAEATTIELSREELAYVVVEINNNINASSGYLGAISDRSKELYFNKQTVGEYFYSQLEENPHARLKNQVFYRQDYLDEFEAVWEMQRSLRAQSNLDTDLDLFNAELKKEIRDVIIFYQRRLKSQKHLISNCEFEKYHKVIPKSSPLFQEFKIWQIINNIELKDINTRTVYKNESIEQEVKDNLFQELNIRVKMTDKEILKILVENPDDFKLNYKELEGNRTNAALYEAYQKILEFEGEELSFSKMSADEINDRISSKFLDLGINVDILIFNADLKENEYHKQDILQLWHLLYSFEGDNTKTGDEKLIKALNTKYGFKPEYARLIANAILQGDYGSLSSKAIRKIMPYLKEGNRFDIACGYAKYNHSSSLTKEERATRVLKDAMNLLPKNSLRNPVVEKILNQLVNVVNAIIIDENLGKPDEIRIELARELKKSAKEREDMTRNINKATADHEKIRVLLQNDFGITKVTRNDIIRYKLWRELECNGFKTIYTNAYVSKEKLFSKEFDIEHIIPKARLFDDSFSNKTITIRQVNIDKSNETAYDYLKETQNEADFNQYLARIEKLYKSKNISKTKYNKLMMKLSEIPEGFIERDLRNSQYIAKKAKEMLEEVVRTVNTSTGIITDRLRSDWQLINIMKELNLPKYEKLGLLETIEGKNGKPETRIKDWTKRNDHRHHAMDALTVAFTSYSHVQYLNNLHARTDKKSSIFAIENKYLHRNEKNKLVFNAPMPLHEFRIESKKHLENILISFKAKNKVVTRNKNKSKLKGKDNYNTKIELTPRGQLHKETVYGKIERYKTKPEKVGSKFDLTKIKQVAKQSYREALLTRLIEFGSDPKKAFAGKNAPSKNPVFVDEAKTIELPEKVKLVWKETDYTKRVEINSDNFKTEKNIEKVIDVGIKSILLNRLAEYNGDSKKAFVNLEENPIWLNKDKGISIKRVTISGVSNAEALHHKKDHNGTLILDAKGNKQPTDFVSTGNNHHVAIYRDAKGKLQEEVVSFYEAVHRVNEGIPIINKNKEGLEFLFTMKQNEYFVFPSDNFKPNEIDMLNPKNTNLISPYLFRVQKIATTNYMFRHHLETTVEDKKELKDVSYKNIRSANGVQDIIKVRINHLGQIVKIGE
ncbi:MAG: type II CRISPR RNA-guided endonuclease Cas9 [Bacteroidetes bacterium 4572_77]|nr:MAG: type II CRISPR RNA-guided endonuclease Cas9 [Bacteroidetes bacterium 4572_77]